MALLLGVVYCRFGGRLGGRVGWCFGVMSEVPGAGIVIDITIRALLGPVQSPPGYPGASQLGAGGPPGASQIPPIPSGFKMCGFHMEMRRFPQLTKSLPGLLRGSPEAPCDLPRDRRGSLGNHNNPQGLPMVAPGIPGDPREIPKDSPRTPQAAGQQIVALSHTVAY